MENTYISLSDNLKKIILRRQRLFIFIKYG